MLMFRFGWHDCVIILRHRIVRVEAFGRILRIPLMSVKVRVVFQEIVILDGACIPGGVQIVVQVIQLHNIPAVGTAVTQTGNQSGINSLFQCQPVKQKRIALANCRFVDQSRIC